MYTPSTASLAVTGTLLTHPIYDGMLAFSPYHPYEPNRTRHVPHTDAGCVNLSRLDESHLSCQSLQRRTLQCWHVECPEIVAFRACHGCASSMHLCFDRLHCLAGLAPDQHKLPFKWEPSSMEQRTLSTLR